MEHRVYSNGRQVFAASNAFVFTYSHPFSSSGQNSTPSWNRLLPQTYSSPSFPYAPRPLKLNRLCLSEEWPRLREMIKYKIQKVCWPQPLHHTLYLQAFNLKNIDIFLGNPEYSTPKQPPPFVNRPDTNGGLRLPPVRPRARNPTNPIEARVSYMTKEETEEATAGIFAQLDEFEE